MEPTSTALDHQGSSHGAAVIDLAAERAVRRDDQIQAETSSDECEASAFDGPWPIVLPTAHQELTLPAKSFDASLGHPALGLIDRMRSTDKAE